MVSSMVETPAGPPETAGVDPDSLQPTSAVGSEPDPDRQTTSPLEPLLSTGWGPYRRFELIGRGGMGVVFRAYDGTLERTVAVKLLRAGSPELAERFFREARAQARVRHDGVCAVYEAGTVDRTPYIVMQYIAGESLARAAQGMSVEQRVQIVARVADAVHAAHRIGLIHRDIKPGNVMVETTPDGELRPYVLDFGLVRDESAPGETRDGEVVGTPAYMAPEQVLGELDRLDRRTDVYSLGAVLYELLVGRPPFPGVHRVAQLVRTLEQEPTTPRRLAPEIAPDLETIVLKCLEKAPEARYQSARALADDLERFLDGEPIEARPQPALVRLRRRLRKHRALVAAAAVTAVSLLAAAGAVGVQHWRAGQQADLARAFGQSATEVEWLLRVARMSPPHDIRRERLEARRRLADLEARVEDAGTLARAPGLSALGRGLLALGEHERARQHLERAWQLGQRQPEVAYALGLARSRVYLERLEATRAVRDPEQRAARVAAIAAELEEPTLDALRASRGSPTVPADLLEALIALHEGRTEDGLAGVARALEHQPWLYEAHLLEGQLHAAAARRLRDAGDYAGAETAAAAADHALRQAVAVGRSDPEAWEGLCDLWINVMLTRQASTGSGIEAALDEALEACDQARRVDPGLVSVQVQQAVALRLLGAFQHGRGLDPTATLARSVEAAAVAVAARPPRWEAHEALGAALVEQARHEFSSGLDPRPLLERAVPALERAASATSPQASTFDWLGSAHRLQGWFEWARGLDPTTSWESALAAYERALELEPRSAMVRASLADVYATRASHAVGHGRDPSGDLAAAVDAYRRSIADNPNDAGAHSGLGTVHFTRAEADLARGRDPRPAVAAAVRAFERAAAITPRDDYPPFGHGYALLLQAQWELERGDDPRATLERARARLETSLGLNPRNAFAAVQRANALRLAAAAALDRRGSGRGPIERARSAARRALAIDPSLSDAHLALGRVELLAADWLQQQGLTPDRTLAEAADALGAAAAANPGDARTHAALATALARRAPLWAAGSAPRAEMVRDGLAAAERALAVNPSSREADEARRQLRLLAR